jgi:transcription termination factor Rho
MRRLTRRERAYLRAVQHGAKIDYSTFVARGSANAQHVAAIQAAQKQGLPKPTFAKPKPQQPAPQAMPAAPAAVQPAARDDLPELRVAELQKLDVKALLALAEEAGIADDIPDLHKHDLIYELLRNHARRGGAIRTEGILEIAKDGSGFLRNRSANYHTSPEDAQVPPALIRKFGLRPGQLIVGPCRPPENASGKNRFFVLAGVDTVNGLAPNVARRITPFENQTPLFPDKRIVLETTSDGIEMRVTDLFSPIGFGQRGLIVAPPRTGKTVIMQKMANAISQNYPDATLIILLIDERPEEVTDMERNTKALVIASTFDEPPEKHAQVADNVIEMARRKVEMGEDVIILLDSITRLGRAYNTLAPTNGRILSGGVEATALQRPKRFFGSARNLENGGSLTIIATALIETGSRMDEVIFEEFKGTGNMELVLDRALADRRVFPAINIAKSGTRKEELLVNNQIEMTRTWMLRRAIGDAPPAEAMEMIISRMKKFPNNHDFLMGIQS